MKILATALLLGVTGDLLLRAMPLGINVFLWTVLLLAGVAYITRDLRSMLFGGLGALVVSAGIAWRDSHPLSALDFLLLLVFYAFLCFRARGVRVWATGILAAAAALVMSALLSATGVFQLIFSDLKWREMQPGAAVRRTLTVLRGALIALPLLLIFFALLTSADPAFASIMTNLFNIDVAEFIGHVLFTLFIAVPVAGYLHSLITPRDLPHVERPSWFHLAAAETNIAIGLIDVLFAAFVAVQIRYFFGGAALVEVAPHLTYADYARRGFFELVAVAALVIPMLLVAEWLIESAGRKTFRVLALAQVLLVFVILVSAYRRMQLYVDNFGLTQLRFYTTAFMFLLGALLAWLVATVLTGRRAQFFIGAVASGLIVVIVLHAINPDALIVRTNLA
ncbi:MAG TPA: DUF4173 domain-containing protein, partial [Thermoanaerobaculia bacterium]